MQPRLRTSALKKNKYSCQMYDDSVLPCQWELFICSQGSFRWCPSSSLTPLSSGRVSIGGAGAAGRPQPWATPGSLARPAWCTVPECAAGAPRLGFSGWREGRAGLWGLRGTGIKGRGWGGGGHDSRVSPGGAAQLRPGEAEGWPSWAVVRHP